MHQVTFQDMAKFHADGYARCRQDIPTTQSPNLKKFLLEETERHLSLYLYYSADNPKPLQNAGINIEYQDGTWVYAITI